MTSYLDLSIGDDLPHLVTKVTLVILVLGDVPTRLSKVHPKPASLHTSV